MLNGAMDQPLYFWERTRAIWDQSFLSPSKNALLCNFICLVYGEK